MSTRFRNIQTFETDVFSASLADIWLGFGMFFGFLFCVSAVNACLLFVSNRFALNTADSAF